MVLEEGGIDAEYQLAIGDPADAHLECAEKDNADLIVVGTESGFFSDLFGTSVSRSVGRRADCDVLIVH